MKKVNALVIGILLIFFISSPFTSALADSDPGLSSQVWSNTFAWYSGFPMVDAYGYMDLNDWSITYRSNGQDSSSPGAGDVVYLYQPGDYVEYSFNGYDLLSNYHSSLWGIQFGQNPYYGSGGLDDLKYILKQGYNTSDSFYQYIRGFQYDNREIDWAHVIFTYPGTGITTIHIEYDGTPAIWNCIYIKFNGWRTDSTNLTTAELIALQGNISTTFNVARLADLLQVSIDSSDIDLSTLESTTASILQKLANVPDIIHYIDQIEYIDSNILNAINTFYSYYSTQHTYLNFDHTPINAFDSDFNPITFNTYITSHTIYYLFDLGSANDSTYSFYGRLYLYAQNPPDYHISYTTINNTNVSSSLSYSTDVISLLTDNSTGSDPYRFYYIDFYCDIHKFTSRYVVIKLESSNSRRLYYNNNQFAYYSTDMKFHETVLLYLKQLVFGSNTNLPSDIQQTTDTITEQVTDIVEFEDNYNQSLESSATQINVSSYEIQQTQGMSFMRTYTELNFDIMQNFRILFLTPLILALAAFFLRRRT